MDPVVTALLMVLLMPMHEQNRKKFIGLAEPPLVLFSLKTDNILSITFLTKGFANFKLKIRCSIFFKLIDRLLMSMCRCFFF